MALALLERFARGEGHHFDTKPQDRSTPAGRSTRASHQVRRGRGVSDVAIARARPNLDLATRISACHYPAPARRRELPGRLPLAPRMKEAREAERIAPEIGTPRRRRKQRAAWADEARVRIMDGSEAKRKLV